MLSVIIINYNSAHLIKDCIASLYKETSKISFEIIVVDNSNNEADKKLITQQFPQVVWLNMGYNAGFSRANNLAMSQAQGDVILLLNPDTIILKNAVENCYTTFIKDKPYTACGVQLLNNDGSFQISGNFAMKGGLNYLLPLPYIGAILKKAGNLLQVKKPNLAQANCTLEVDWINGAFLMVKKEAVKKAGMLDEEFFLYAEEAEWCSRLKKYGKLCIYGQYTVIHLQGQTATDAFGSTDKTYYNIFDKKGLQLMLSNFLRIRKEFGSGWYFVQLGVYTLAVPVFYVAGFFQNLFKIKNPFQHMKKANGLAKNVCYIWKSTRKIVFKKPHFYKVL